MEAILSAAGELIGTRLSEPTGLGGSQRSNVLRCRTEAGGTVVIKKYPDEPAGRDSFAAEAAGLALGLIGPDLLAADGEQLLLVMEDLGDAPSLADVLLAEDPRDAADGLLVWARTLGTVAAESVRRREEMAALWVKYSQGPMFWDCAAWTAKACAELLTGLEAAGIAVPQELAEELTQELADAGRELVGAYPAFTPGDTCLDNNLLTPRGLRLIDFEGACFMSVFLTAAYCRMPFPSCWCVYRLPAAVAADAEAEFRRQVVTVYPELADDAVWEAGMRRAVAAWTVQATVWLLRGAAEDKPIHTKRPVAPTVRQVLRHRWETAAALTEFPAVAGLVRLLLRELGGGWDRTPLAPYPAFEGDAGPGASAGTDPAAPQ